MTAPIAKKAASSFAAKSEVNATASASKPAVQKSNVEKSTPKKSVNKTTVQRNVKKTGRAISSKKRMVMPRIPPAKSTVRYRQVIAAEIVIGSFLILVNINSDDPDKKSYSENIKAEAAFLIVMCILSLLSVGGPSMARTSAWMGGVIVLVMMVRNPTVWQKFGKGKQPSPNIEIHPPGGGIQSIANQNGGGVINA